MISITDSQPRSTSTGSARDGPLAWRLGWSTVRPMDGLHAGLAIVTGIAVVLLLAASVAAGGGLVGRGGSGSIGRCSRDSRRARGRRERAPRARDRAPGPPIQLHFLYAVVLAGLALTVRGGCRPRPTRRVGGWLVLGSIVLGGVLVRAFMTVG
jgi:hypothetical protein